MYSFYATHALTSTSRGKSLRSRGNATLRRHWHRKTLRARPPTLSPSIWRLIDWNRFVIALEIARYNFIYVRTRGITREAS